MFRKPNTREMSVAIVTLAALLTGLSLPTRLIVSTSPSLDHRLFFRTSHHHQEIRDGDYLVFRHPDSTFVRPGLHGQNQLFIKQVGCGPGETLRRDKSDLFYCGQTLLGKALSQDSKGRNLPQFIFNGEVPDSSFFMLGSHPRSFDSRYFGFIHADEIASKALPLW